MLNTVGVDAVLSDAANRLGWADGFSPNRHYALEWFAFPQTWGSTALGFGGPGGQMITSAQTVVVIDHYGPDGKTPRAVVYFGGEFAYEAEPNSGFIGMVHERRMPSRSSYVISKA